MTIADEGLTRVERLVRGLPADLCHLQVLVDHVQGVRGADGTWEIALDLDWPNLLQEMSNLHAALVGVMGPFRKDVVVEMRAGGASLATIARLLGCSRQRVSYLLRDAGTPPTPRRNGDDPRDVAILGGDPSL